MKRLPLRHIVCPVDLSGLFRRSLAEAVALARARGADLRAVHVVPAEGTVVRQPLDSGARNNLMQRLRQSLTEVDPAHRLVGGAVRVGDPATQILDYARAMSADLIVMGAPGADRPVGPVGSVVIARSDCSVLTVPEHGAVPPNNSGLFRRILCAVDAAPSSATVIRQALSLAWETGGRLRYACVVGAGDPVSASQARDALLAAIPTEANQWCEMDVVVIDGTPDVEIVRLAVEEQADVVVIGAPRRWTSTTHAVLGRAVCPVLVTHDARPLPWPAATSAQAAGINRSRPENT